MVLMPRTAGATAQIRPRLGIEPSRSGSWPLQGWLADSQGIGLVTVPDAIPLPGERILVRGAPIWDCGHPGRCGFHNELHPLIAMVWLHPIASW